MNKMLRLSVFAVLVHCVLPGAAAAETKDDDAYTALPIELVEDVAHSIRRTHAETGVEKLSERLLQAMRDVPRHAFVPPQLRPYAYFDVPLPVGHDQNISQPFLIALMIELVDIKATDVVFETGTGAGYQAAILSKLAKQVFSVEVVAPLARRAQSLIAEMGYENVEIRHADGFYGWRDRGPYDAMIIKEAINFLPGPLLNQLKPGGRLIAPIGPLDRGQMLTLVEKSATGAIKETPLIPVRFSPLHGGERI